MLQIYLPLIPKEAQRVSDHLAIYRYNGQIEFYTASGPIFTCKEDDSYSMRLSQGIMVSTKKASCSELAKALGVHRTTVYRNAKAYEAGGSSALLTKHDGPGFYKLTDEKALEVQRLLDKGETITQSARMVGVTEGAVRYAIKNGRIIRTEGKQHKPTDDIEMKSASERSDADRVCSIGIGAKRCDERVLTSLGNMEEAAPDFHPSEDVPNSGVLLALPFVEHLGLLEAGEKVYGGLKKGFYGLRTILILLAFMAFLRIKNPEQIKGQSPGELGIILGMDRSPEVKTIRKKLKELGFRNKAGDFMTFLTRRWTEDDEQILGYIYIDGHVRPYHGRKHKLPKTHVSRRRLCMPATTDYWVNDTNCDPLFLVTAEANDGLLSMVNAEILPELRSLAGKDRRVTIVFDREGWSPKSFSQWYKDGFDVITYRKGRYVPWPEYCFQEVTCRVREKEVKYLLGERSIEVKKDFWMREVRRLCDNGHQTSIMTTRQDLNFTEIAERMFLRWNQENYFRYMREEYALDHLVTYNVEAGDAERLVPNPEKKEKKKELGKLQRKLEKRMQEYGEKAVKNDGSLHPTMRGFNIVNPGQKKEILALEKEIEEAKAALKELPDKVAVKEVLKDHEIVRLETERKQITDTVKMLCYRAETAMFNLLLPFFPRNLDEGRTFLKNLFQLPADIIPDESQNMLIVKFHTMSDSRSNRILGELCGIINEMEYVYPGTDMKMFFKPAGCD